MDQGILMTVKSIFKRESVSGKCIRWIICVPFFPARLFFKEPTKNCNHVLLSLLLLLQVLLRPP